MNALDIDAIVAEALQSVEAHPIRAAVESLPVHPKIKQPYQWCWSAECAGRVGKSGHRTRGRGGCAITGCQAFTE
jgi:hypothetical protein